MLGQIEKGIVLRVSGICRSKIHTVKAAKLCSLSRKERKRLAVVDDDISHIQLYSHRGIRVKFPNGIRNTILLVYRTCKLYVYSVASVKIGGKQRAVQSDLGKDAG